MIRNMLYTISYILISLLRTLANKTLELRHNPWLRNSESEVKSEHACWFQLWCSASAFIDQPCIRLYWWAADDCTPSRHLYIQPTSPWKYHHPAAANLLDSCSRNSIFRLSSSVLSLAAGCGRDEMLLRPHSRSVMPVGLARPSASSYANNE